MSQVPCAQFQIHGSLLRSFAGQPEKVKHTKSRIYARDYSKHFYFNLFQIFDYTVYRMVYSSDLSLLGGVPAQLSQHEVEAIAAMWVAICCSRIFCCWPLEQPIPFVLLFCPVQISTTFCGVQTDAISNQPQACLDEHGSMTWETAQDFSWQSGVKFYFIMDQAGLSSVFDLCQIATERQLSKPLKSFAGLL